MRVAFIDQSAQLGGVEYSTLRVAQAMDKSRFNPIIICPEEGDLPNLARQAGLEVQIVPSQKFPSVSLQWGKRYVANPLGFLSSAINVLRTTCKLECYLRASPVDIIITKGLLAHFYAGIAAFRLKIPCIWYVQEEVDSKRAGGFYRHLLKQCARFLPAKIVVDAEALLDQFDGFSQSNRLLQVISNGVDTNQFAPFSDQERVNAKKSFQISEHTLTIGQSSRIIPLKGQDILLQAFTQMAQDYPDTHLLFVGVPLFGNQEFERELKTLVEQSGLSERVTFTGFLPDVRQGLAAMDIFVHASVETDSPISVMEAMACGLAVIVSEVHGTVEMIKPDKDALLFEPRDSIMLAHELEKLYKSEQLRSDLGKEARQSVIQKFSLYQSVTQLQELIEEVYAS
ncbi:MAG: glycosyltransferase family 4 protein [Pelolinea sp.]|nr:glycosyltransferase family 4 protein [Pelolinea sp.]